MREKVAQTTVVPTREAKGSEGSGSWCEGLPDRDIGTSHIRAPVPDSSLVVSGDSRGRLRTGEGASDCPCRHVDRTLDACPSAPAACWSYLHVKPVDLHDLTDTGAPWRLGLMCLHSRLRLTHAPPQTSKPTDTPVRTGTHGGPRVGSRTGKDHATRGSGVEPGRG